MNVWCDKCPVWWMTSVMNVLFHIVWWMYGVMNVCVINVLFYTLCDKCLLWSMLDVMNVWCDECPVWSMSFSTDCVINVRCDECLVWSMSFVIKVWCDECLFLPTVWWMSGVINVLFYTWCDQCLCDECRTILKSPPVRNPHNQSDSLLCVFKFQH